jgi:hypothetical protein
MFEFAGKFVILFRESIKIVSFSLCIYFWFVDRNKKMALSGQPIAAG